MHIILLVEDNEAFRQALATMLYERLPGVEILSAGNGTEAMAALERHPDLILMDVSLPGENGIELTRQVKEREPATAVVVLTGYCMPEYREAAFRNGANEFLCKDSTSAVDIVTLLRGLWGEQAVYSNPEKS